MTTKTEESNKALVLEAFDTRTLLGTRWAEELDRSGHCTHRRRLACRARPPQQHALRTRRIAP